MTWWMAILLLAFVVVDHVMAGEGFDDFEDNASRCVIEIICDFKDYLSIKRIFDKGSEEFQISVVAWYKELTKYTYRTDDMDEYFSHFGDAFCPFGKEEKDFQLKEYPTYAYVFFDASWNLILEEYIAKGAVVSRDYGLSCIEGLHGATRQFQTGDYVLLDGNKGILQKLSKPKENI